MMTAEQLKGSILQLAMQGKLVEQRSDEGTGEEILYKIEKQLELKKKFTISEEEILFEIPKSWAWSKVGNITVLYNGRAFKPSDWTDDGLPIVRIQNLNDENAPYNRYNGSIDEVYHLYGGELLFAWSGTPGTSFGAHIWRNKEAVLNQHIFKIEFAEKYIDKKYFSFALNFQVLNLIRLAHGSAGLQHVTKGVFQNTLIPLPPLAEQKRIVAKIEELMPFVEQYAAASTKLNTLNTTFPDMMKKSILQEAVQGKLVPQDPNDEPASVLLKKIAEEKKRLIKEGKIKKQKPLPEITEDEIPFDIPESWEWCRLSELCTAPISYGIIKLGKEDINGIKVLRCSDVKPNYIDDSNIRTVEKKLSDEYSRTILEGNEVVINVRGTLGGCAVVPLSMKGFNVAREVAVIKNHCLIDSEYLCYVLQTHYFVQFMMSELRGIAYKGLNMGILSSFPVPIPPLCEQKRIVNCINSIIHIIDNIR